MKVFDRDESRLDAGLEDVHRDEGEDDLEGLDGSEAGVEDGVCEVLGDGGEDGGGDGLCGEGGGGLADAVEEERGDCKGEDVREDLLLDPVDAADGDELLDVFDCLDADGVDGVDEHGGADLDELVLAVEELRDELGDEPDGLKETVPGAVVREAEDCL